MKYDRECAAWINHVAHHRISPHTVKISGFLLKLNTLLRTPRRQTFGLVGTICALRPMVVVMETSTVTAHSITWQPTVGKPAYVKERCPRLTTQRPDT